MKGATIVSADENFFDLAKGILENNWPMVRSSEGLVQVQNSEGKVFALYGKIDLDSELQGDVLDLPGAQSLRGFVVECQWDAYFVQVIEQIHAGLNSPFWIVDGNGAVWTPNNIDVERLIL